jgi:hypothetical protein
VDQLPQHCRGSLPDFCAVHESVNGPSRHFAACNNASAIGVIADSGNPAGRQIYGFTA